MKVCVSVDMDNRREYQRLVDPDADPETSELIAERGYLYDSSIFPGPFM